MSRVGFVRHEGTNAANMLSYVWREKLVNTKVGDKRI